MVVKFNNFFKKTNAEHSFSHLYTPSRNFLVSSQPPLAPNFFSFRPSKNAKLKPFGKKNDWDGDGVPNKKDCQPRNTMRQDWNVIEAKRQGQFVQMMSPKEFISRASRDRDGKEEYKWEQDYDKYYDYETKKMEPVQTLGKYITSKNKKVTIPFLSDDGSHEGRHRAYAAHLQGQKMIPVSRPPPQEWRTEKVATTFIGKAFPHLLKPEYKHDPYLRETKSRLQKQDFPGTYYAGNKKLEQAYRESLIEGGGVSQEYFEDKDKDGFIAAADRDDNNSNNPRGAHFRQRRVGGKDDDAFIAK